jgi:hypothetical protein
LGDAAEWTPDHERLTEITELLAGANWQRAGAPSSKKPRPIKRPAPPDAAI